MLESRVAESTVAPRRRGPLRQLLGSATGLVGLTLTVAVLLVAVVGPLLAPFDPFASVGPSLTSPGGEHLMGTDSLGRDVFSGVLQGARTSLLVAVGVGLLAALIGIAVGLGSGYAGGRVDDLLMRGTEFVQVLPRFFLAIVVLALFGPGIDRLVIVLGMTSWAILARVVRSETLSLRQREFVLAARALGAGWPRVLLRELLPSVLPSTITFVGLIMAQAILLEASLGFLGLGDPNAMTWGFLAGQAQRYLRVAWWLSVFPGLAIMIAVVGINQLGDGLTEALGGRASAERAT